MKQSNATFNKPTNLKISQELYTILGQGFDTFFAYWVNQGKESAVGEAINRALESERVRWDLYWAIDFNLRYDDSHPAYHSGTDSEGNKRKVKVRIVNYNEKYSELSRCDDLTSQQKDNALKAIFKELKKAV